MPARRSTIKPRIVVSKCLGFSSCRYDGTRVELDLVQRMKRFVTFITICPEIEIGLSTPREPMRLVRKGDSVEMFQPATGRKLTSSMKQFSRGFLRQVGQVDGFLLKSRSPSCGLGDVKLFQTRIADSKWKREATGQFAQTVRSVFPDHAAVSDSQLLNNSARDRWLTRVFLSAEFRAIRTAKALRAFHDRHALLFTMFNKTLERELRAMSAGVKSVESRLPEYFRLFNSCLSRTPRRASVAQLLAIAFDHYASFLSRWERIQFRSLIDKYLDAKATINGCRKHVQVLAVRYDKTFVMQHSAFRPYPPALM